MSSLLHLEQENLALRAELERAQEKLFRLDQVKRNFVALAASELRTPVTVLLGYAKLLEERAVDGARETATILASQATRLQRIVDSIIVLQQLDFDQVRILPKELYLSELGRNAIQAHVHESALKSLTVENRIRDEMTIKADRELVSLVFANLLSNAIKFSPMGGQILISAQASNTHITTSISDQGIGILAEECHYVFERFYQPGDPLKRRYHGIGLGLAIAKAIVELHHGQIWVESALNQGSTFYFTLPSAKPPAVSELFHANSATYALPIRAELNRGSSQNI